MAKQLILGTRSLKTVVEYDKQLWVRPGVALTEYEMGVFVQLFEQEHHDKPVETLFWGLVFPHNIFNCWRAMKLLELIPSIENSSLCNAYYAGMRFPHQSDLSRVKAITDQVGTKARQHIMNSPIPQEVVDVLLVLLDQENNIPTVSITSELDAHTLAWNPAFTDFGIEHPALLLARDKALEPYRKYLALYATFHGLTETSSFMEGIQTRILAAIEREIDAHGIDIAFATAVVKERLAQLERQSPIIDDFDAATPDQIIKVTVDWVSTNMKKGWFIKTPIHMPDACEALLRQQLDEWDSIEVHHLFES